MQKTNLNLIPGSVFPVINVSQYDEGRQFQLALFDGASAYDLTGKTVTILVGKTDGNGCAYGVSDLVNGVPVIAVSGNTITVTTPVQMTAAAGNNMAEIRVESSTIDVRSLNFVLCVEPAALDPGTPLSATEIPAIERAGWDAVDHYPRINPGNNHWEVWDVTAGDWVDTGVSAGGGGVTDYDDLTNRPQINGFMLTGNKTAADLGLATDAAMTGASSGSAGAKGLVPAPAAGGQGKFLRGDGTWQNETNTLAGLTDTNISSPTNDQVLKYDSNSGKWINGAGGGGGSSTLAGLSDVNLSTPTDAQPLTYDNASGKWVNGGIIPTANGGTGNADGYIRTGIKNGTTAGTRATAEGTNNTSSGQDAHAEGIGTTSEGQGSHSEGWGTTAHGPESHAEGISTEARGSGAHSEGGHTSATGNYAHAGGYYTLAQYDNQTAIGKYNKNESDSLFEVGNGTGTGSDRSNAIAVKNDGRILKSAADAFPAASNLATPELKKAASVSSPHTKSYEPGEYVFIIEDDKQYKVIGSSTVGTTTSFVVDTNIEEVTVGGELRQLSSDIAALNDTVEYTIPANTTWRQALTTFAGMIDYTKVSQRAVLNIGSGYYHLSEKTSTSATFAYEIIASSKNRLIVAVVRANTPYYHINDNGSYTDMSTDTASGTLKLYY